MGKGTNTAIDAREKARQRRLALERDEQAAKDRIDAATAEVIVAQGDLTESESVRAAAVAAAQAAFDAAVATAAKAAGTVRDRAERRIGAALRKLAAEKQSTGRIADLTELSPAEVRRLSQVGKDTSEPKAAGPVAAMPDPAAAEPASPVQAEPVALAG